MTKSESIGKLTLALSKTQKEIKGAIKDCNNPFFKSAYADLSSVWEACREPLTKNELAIIQTLDTCEHGVIIETTLSHSSGEWISGRVHMNPTKNDPQGIGSAITYARRYALAAIVGVCPEDDDANDASGLAIKKDKSVHPPQGESPKQDEPSAPPTSDKKDYKFLETMQKEKKRIGEVAYYKVLGWHGFTKSSEVPDNRELKLKIFADLKQIADE